MAKSSSSQTNNKNDSSNSSSSNNYNKNKKKLKRHEAMQEELQLMAERIAAETPARGFAPPLHQQVTFRSLPLSQSTLRGLEAANYSIMTAIQNACIPHALAVRDILGAAKTGSGKTLAFVVPLLERLYAERFSPTDGCGAIIVCPTRELAVQIFNVVRKVGAHHALTAGLVVGGSKEFRLEQDHLAKTNIVVCTPGRLLQHLEQTPDFDVSNLQVLVLDEADRILDMGFRDQMKRILEYLPTERRQTMLFSATQTRKVSDLAALSLRSPEYLGVHDDELSSTPTALKQSMVVVPLPHKLDAIYSFVKSHLKSKIIIFLASCSQVRHAWELFCALQPGIPIMALHGKLVQTKRNLIYQQFVQRPHAVLFATDVAARGLDVPHVHWVVQADAPEDAAMYVHRVGRTARYKAGGKALLMVTPQEEEVWTKRLSQSKIPIKTVSINPNKTVLVTQKATALVTSRPALKELAKKAFKSHVRSIHLLPGQPIAVHELPLAEFSASLGLASMPKLGFLKKHSSRQDLRDQKNVNHKLHKLKEQIRAEKLAKRVNQVDVSSSSQKKKRDRSYDSEEDDDLLVVKQHQQHLNSDDEDLPNVDIHRVSAPRQPQKKIRIDADGTGLNTKIQFKDDDDESSSEEEEDMNNEQLEANHEEYMAKVRARLAANADLDQQEAKDRVRAKHRKRRLLEKGEQENDGNNEGIVATLGGASADGASMDSNNGDGDSSDSDSSDDDSSNNDGGSNTVNIQEQEELALSMIRGP